jgi:peroxiredoxin
MSDIILNIGDVAPDFEAPDQHGQIVKLKDFECRNILLSFHPLAFTPVCDIQMKTLELKFNVFKEINTVALGISVDSQYSKKAWAESIGIKNTRLIADFWKHGEIARKYGQFIEKAGVSGRANILVNHKMQIQWIKRYEIPQVPDIEEVISEIKKI